MLSGSKVKVGSWVSIKDGCPISFEVEGSARSEFRCGPEGDAFEFVIESEALRELIKVATEALRDMDARFAREEAERAAEGQSER